MDGRVGVQVVEGVAQVRLTRPDKLNALTLEMLDDLVATARALRADRSLRAVVLTGAGDTFCAGLDLPAALRRPGRIAIRFLPRPWRGTNTFQEACWAWRRLPVPVVAAVRGHCLGAGLQLALAADFRITTPQASWSVLEARWGLVPDMTGIRTLAELVRPDVAKRLTMTGEVLTGEQAVGLGLATGCSDDPVAAAHELLAPVLTRSPDAVGQAKALFTRTWTSSPRRTFAAERLAQLRLMAGPNAAVARRVAQGRPEAYLPRGTLRGRG